MGVYAELVRQDQANGTNYAAAYIAGETAKSTETRLMQRVEQMIAPFQQAQAQYAETQRLTQRAEQTFETVLNQKDDQGNPIFPEAGNPEAETEIGAAVGILMQMGLKEDIALSPTGIRLAALMYRDALGQTSPSSAQPNAPQNPAAAAVAESLLKSTQPQDPVNGPSSGVTRPGAVPTYEDEVKRSIREARPIDPDLGFARRSAAI
jgi:hypothetical protein